MNMFKRATLSRRLSFALYVVSIGLLIYSTTFYCSLYSFHLTALAFIVGALAAYPMIKSAWTDLKDGWEEKIGDTDKTYEDFFEDNTSKEEEKEIVKYHWKQTWWTVPYAFTVYIYLGFLMFTLQDIYSLIPFFAGSVLAVSITSYDHQKELELP